MLKFVNTCNLSEELKTKLYKKYSNNGVSSFKKWLNSGSKLYCTFLYNKKELIGWCCVLPDTMPEFEPVEWTIGVFVLDRYRGKGYAKKLVKERLRCLKRLDNKPERIVAQASRFHSFPKLINKYGFLFTLLW